VRPDTAYLDKLPRQQLAFLFHVIQERGPANPMVLLPNCHH